MPVNSGNSLRVGTVIKSSCILAFGDDMPKARPRRHYMAAMQADGTYTIIAHQGIDEPSISLPGFATLDAALDEIARLEAIDRRNAIVGPMQLVQPGG
jgi:hypothetical protein